MAAPVGNKYAIGNNGGQPPTFASPEELQRKIDEFIESCSSKIIKDDEGEDQVDLGKPITISGLAYYLGFESRQSFYDYEKREEFSYTVKRARLFIESSYEQRQ